jgi:hypothetical protein
MRIGGARRVDDLLSDREPGADSRKRREVVLVRQGDSAPLGPAFGVSGLGLGTLFPRCSWRQVLALTWPLDRYAVLAGTAGLSPR